MIIVLNKKSFFDGDINSVWSRDLINIIYCLGHIKQHNEHILDTNHLIHLTRYIKVSINELNLFSIGSYRICLVALEFTCTSLSTKILWFFLSWPIHYLFLFLQ